MGEEEFPALCRWRREYISDEAVSACLPSKEQLVAYYAPKKDHSCHVPGTMGTRDGNGGRESLLATNREQLGYTSL
jgi:hypothetical protein